MVERVAKAIIDKSVECDAEIRGPLVKGGLFNALARAAIAAMRKPTEAMKVALRSQLCDFDPGTDDYWAVALLVWEQGIDAALAEKDADAVK